MLTNNKKRSFVKLIALTLAALMVFSVCLTGCTDEDARLAAEAAKDAADKAQSSADAAQTAADGKTTTEAVAAQIAEALKPYLKADAALSEADVDKKVADLKAAIEASLKNYQAKGDYATKADVDKKQDKGNYATKDDLKGYQSKGDYATKGDLAGYQTKGDYATKEDLKALAGFASSEELDALTAALNEFTETALTKDAIAEIVTEALADYATTVYVDEAIAAAVAEEREITAADIKKAIDEALADYMTAAEIEARLEEMNKALTEKIESYFIGFEPEKVVELLKNVDKAMNKDEWAQATVLVTETLEKTVKLFKRVHDNSYTQDRKAEINAIMLAINGIPADYEVFKKITNKGGSYLDDFHYDNMHGKDDAGNTLDNVDTNDAIAKVLTDLTVVILRAPSVADVTAIKTQIEKAIAVPSFVEDITVWRNDLYTLGEVVPVMVNKDNELRPSVNFDFTKTATWKQAVGLNDNTSMKYHNETVSSGATAKAQVVKAAHAGAYAQDVAALEKLIVEYTLESMRFGTSADSANFGAFNSGAVMALYEEIKDGKHVAWHWVTPGTYKGEKWLDMEVSALTGTETAVPGGWNFKGIFAGINTSAIPSGAGNGGLVARNWDYTNNANAGLVMKGYQDNKYLDPMIKVDLIDGYAAGSYKLIALLNKYTPEVTGDNTTAAKAKLAETYDALHQMIKDAQDANDKANAAFTGIPGKTSGTAADSNTAHDDPNQNANAPHFLWHIGHNYSKNHKTSDNKYVCNCSLLTDDQYVAALKDYMVEWTEDEAHAPVPDSWEIPFWLSPVYTVRGLVAPWNYTGANATQAKTLDVYFNYALNINGEDSNAKSYDGITRYELYLKLVDKAWELLYEKYKSYAAQILLTMRNDFRVAAMTATATSESNYTDATLVAAAAKALDLDNTANSDVAQKWTPSTGSKDGFVENYWTGNDAWKWEIGKNVKKQIGPDHKMEGLDHYYYYNNIQAKHAYANSANGVKFDFGSNAKAGDTYIISDVLSALKASQQYIDIELDSVTYGPRMEILVDAENFKNSGMSEFAYKKAQGGRVQDAFDEELAVAMGNFNEIMFRYMLPEINDHYITKAYAAITGLANENVVNTAADDIYAGGVAKYFSMNPGNVADTEIANKLTHFMQVYVTGHSNLAVSGMSQGYRLWTAGDPVQYNFQQLPEVAYANGTMTVKVVPSSVYDALFANVNTDFAVGSVISRAATEKVEAAKGIYNNAINTMANMAVNYRFNDYIQQAKDALYFSFLGYTAVAQNYTVRLALDERYNEAVNALTITEYYANRGGIEAMDYLNAYVTRVLGVAIANDSPYYGLIAKDTTYAKQLVANIPSVSAFINKTDDTITDAWDLVDDNVTKDELKVMLLDKWISNVDGDKNGKIEGAENRAGDPRVTVPFSPMGGFFDDNNYFATGSAAVDFDKAVNVNSVADDGSQLYAH